MREIKFRGKDKYGVWHYGGYVDYLGKPRIVNEVTDGPLYALATEQVIPETLGQYTGLRDSTEQEVYEGDILSDARGRLYVIVWRAGGPCVYSADEYRNMRRKVPVTLHQVSNYVQEGLTVVGNIHDAPEMLDAETSEK